MSSTVNHWLDNTISPCWTIAVQNVIPLIMIWHKCNTAGGGFHVDESCNYVSSIVTIIIIYCIIVFKYWCIVYLLMNINSTMYAGYSASDLSTYVKYEFPFPTVSIADDWLYNPELGHWALPSICLFNCPSVAYVALSIHFHCFVSDTGLFADKQPRKIPTKSQQKNATNPKKHGAKNKVAQQFYTVVPKNWQTPSSIALNLACSNLL